MRKDIFRSLLIFGTVGVVIDFKEVFSNMCILELPFKINCQSRVLFCFRLNRTLRSFVILPWANTLFVVDRTYGRTQGWEDKRTGRLIVSCATHPRRRFRGLALRGLSQLVPVDDKLVFCRHRLRHVAATYLHMFKVSAQLDVASDLHLMRDHRTNASFDCFD